MINYNSRVRVDKIRVHDKGVNGFNVATQVLGSCVVVDSALMSRDSDLTSFDYARRRLTRWRADLLIRNSSEKILSRSAQELVRKDT